MKLPTFLVVGIEKAGTTSIYQYLNQHPQVYMSPVKETNFLERDKERVKIYLYNNLSENSLAMMQNMYQFIGVNGNFIPDTSKRQQVAAVPKNQSLNNLIKTKNPVRAAVSSILRVVMPREMRQKLRSSLINFNSGGKELKPLSSEERQLLIHFYREDNLKLQDLIQKDLSSWLI